MRRLPVVVSALLLAGCMPAGPAGGPASGPTLVLDATNEAERDVAFGYEFESDGTSGGGESLVAACRREAMPFGTISGAYQILVDGDTVLEDVVPAGVGSDRFFVIRLRIAPDGEVETIPPIVVRAPPAASAVIPGCGEP